MMTAHQFIHIYTTPNVAALAKLIYVFSLFIIFEGTTLTTNKTYSNLTNLLNHIFYYLRGLVYEYLWAYK